MWVKYVGECGRSGRAKYVGAVGEVCGYRMAVTMAVSLGEMGG